MNRIESWVLSTQAAQFSSPTFSLLYVAVGLGRREATTNTVRLPDKTY